MQVRTGTEQCETRTDCQSVMMEIVSTKRYFRFLFNEKYNNCEIRYGDLKKQLAEDINNFCAPIRERILIFVQRNYLEYHGSRKASVGRGESLRAFSKTLNEAIRQIISDYTVHTDELNVK